MTRFLFLACSSLCLSAFANPVLIDLSPGDLTGQDLQSDGTTGWVFATEGNNEVLFRTDGTAGGTVRVRSYPPVGAFRAPVSIVGLAPGVAFTQIGSGDLELTDGTVPFVTLGSPPGRLFDAGRTSLRSFFLVLLNSTAPFQLYASNQTAAGTQLVPGVSIYRNGSSPTAVVGDQLYFVTDIGDVGVTDGVTSSVFFARDASRVARGVYACGGFLYIVSQQSGQTAVHVAAPPAMPGLLAPVGSVSLSDLSCSAAGTFFAGRTAAQGTELWRTDGTAAGIVQDLNPGAGSGLPFVRLVPHPDGGLHFPGTDGLTGTQVWFGGLQDGGAVQVSSGAAAPDLLEANVGNWAFFQASGASFMTASTQLVSLNLAIQAATLSSWKSLPQPIAVGTKLISFGSRTAAPIKRDQLWVFDTALPVPVEDGGVRDAGFDAGIIDAGSIDAGRIDAGSIDAGSIDAGSIDAGSIDAGPVDAGPVDAGPVDAGPVDAGPVDAGAVDAGTIDAGTFDAGIIDAGSTDAGAQTDAGVEPPAPPRGCGCDAASSLFPLALVLIAKGRRRSRR